MDISEQNRNSAWQQANEIQRALYGNPESGTKLGHIFTTHSLPSEFYTTYALHVGDVILGLQKKSDLPSLLQSIGITDEVKLMRLVADLYEFLAPLNGAVPAPQSTQPLHQEIAETEAALARVAPVRTMAGDMHDLESQAPQEAPIYRSEQPSITTNPAKTAPRWESEQR